MKRGPAKGQRKDSLTSIKKDSPKTSVTPLFRKRAFSTVNNTLPIPNALSYPVYQQPPQPPPPQPLQQQQQQQHVQPSFRPIVQRQQDRLPSIGFLTMNQPWPRSQYNFYQPPPNYQHQQQQQQGVTQEEPLRSGHTSRSNSVPSYLPSDVAEKKFYPDPEETQQPPARPTSPGMSPKTTPSIASNTTNTTWEDRQVDSYYQIIHPTLPILPSSKIRLRSFLAACPNETLRTALLSGLNGLARKVSNPSTAVSANKSELLRAVLEMSESTGGLVSEEMPLESKSLYLVCLIFLFLYTDESMWLSSAVSIAYSMKLHVLPASGEDSGSRRLFLVLAILDSMNSAVKNVPSFIPEGMIHFDEDRDALCFGSRSGVEILKLCIVLRRVCRVKLQSSCSPYTETYLESLHTELEAVRRDVEGMWDTVPILKALYHSVLVNLYSLRLQVTQSPSTYCAKMMANLTELSSLLVSPLISVSPLMGYFYQLICEGVCDVVQALPSIGDQIQNADFRDKTLKLLDYLQGPGSGSTANCLFAARSGLLSKMDRLLRENGVISSGNSNNNNNNIHMTDVSQTPPGYSEARSPSSTSSASTVSSMAGYKYEGHNYEQGLQQNKPAIRGIMMTAHSGLDKLANVAEKVKLLIWFSIYRWWWWPQQQLGGGKTFFDFTILF